MKISLVEADNSGKIRINHDLLMLVRHGDAFRLPNPHELIPMPEESELFLMPGRRALGYDRASGKFLEGGGMAVAAFCAPGYTLAAHPAYKKDGNAPILPLFAYGAVGFARGKYWLAAAKVDSDPRQRFAQIPRERISRGCARLLENYPHNRLVGHIINNCVRRYDCPAARNFALGRYEAPLPTSRSCNAACLGCISQQSEKSPLSSTPQCRLDFTPSPDEITEVMAIHASREKKPIFSFGQGCEGDPLLNAELLCASSASYRKGHGKGTINCNTNASRPEAVERLANSGLTSLRVSLNSARPEYYNAYYRPKDYSFENVRESMRCGRKAGAHISLNLLYFPGFSDTAGELDALADLCSSCGVGMIQMRNLNIDPDWYRKEMGLSKKSQEPLGLDAFMAALSKACPWLKFGYFNPYLGEKAQINAPMPC